MTLWIAGPERRVPAKIKVYINRRLNTERQAFRDAKGLAWIFKDHTPAIRSTPTASKYGD